MQRVVKCTQEAECTAGLSCDRMIHCRVTYLLPDRLTAQRYHDFIESFHWGCSKMCPWLGCRDYGFSTIELQRTKGKCPAVVERDISRKVNWAWMADCMAYAVVRPNSHGFLPVGTSEGARLRGPSRNTEGFVARFQAVVTTVDANMLRRLP
jgi:hypothetical protein